MAEISNLLDQESMRRDSLSPEQRQELSDLMSTAMEDLGLQAEMSRLSDALRSARPDLDWGNKRKSICVQYIERGPNPGRRASNWIRRSISGPATAGIKTTSAPAAAAGRR